MGQPDQESDYDDKWVVVRRDQDAAESDPWLCQVVLDRKQFYRSEITVVLLIAAATGAFMTQTGWAFVLGGLFLVTVILGSRIAIIDDACEDSAWEQHCHDMNREDRIGP